MGVSDVQFDANAGPVVDLSSRGMQKLDPSFICSDDTHTLILDFNHIMKLDHLERNPGLKQLSVASNRLVRMMGVSRLTELRVLNLPNNSIGYIEGLRDLPHLKWLNLSRNNIKVIEQLSNCVSLQHLDLSENNISTFGDITKLVALKTLLLHGNSITTLCTVPTHLPRYLTILSLAENEISDLFEVSYLSPLHELEQLSIMNNPCVMATPSLPGFDYRPYIGSWCLNLKVLDGYVVSQKEGLKAEWLYSQGKGRSYRPGQHVQLVQYLATVCPLTSSPALETAEDAKLEKILNKQRFHQNQLLEETRGSSPSPPRPTQLDVVRQSPSDATLHGGAREVKEQTAAGPAVASSFQVKEPVVQFNTWVSCDSSNSSLAEVCPPRLREEHIYLEDAQADEDDLEGRRLSSDSTFLPFPSDLEPLANQSDSEDETQTFEPDSLAPQLPAQPKKRDTVHKHHSLPVGQQAGQTLEEVIFCAAAAALSLEARVSTPQNDGETALKLRDPETEEDPRRYDAGSCASKSTLVDLNRAAVKIQAWWRGHYTRRCNARAREVREEIRLHGMQEHIVFLTEKLGDVQKLYEEERLQRLVQEKAVRFLWKELRSMQQWKASVEQQLANISGAAALARVPSPGAREAAAPVASSTTKPPSADVSFPDSGFQSTGTQRAAAAAAEDSFLSSGTEDSLKTVRALSPLRSNGAESTDCSLLEQYLSSVQQMQEEEEEEEAEDAASDATDTTQPSPPIPQDKKSNFPPQEKAGGAQCRDGTSPDYRLLSP